MRDQHEQLMGCLIVFRDITERKQAEQAIRRLNVELGNHVQERTAELQATNQSLRAEIAERKRAQEAVLESERRMQLALRVGHIGAFEADLENNQGTWSPELAEIWGIPNDLTGDLVSLSACLVPFRAGDIPWVS